MSGQTDKRNNEILISARKDLKVFGVKEVDSFDEGGAVLKTDMGELTVEGENLKMGTLDTEQGVVVLSGKINGLFYSDDGHSPEKRGLISKFFR